MAESKILNIPSIVEQGTSSDYANWKYRKYSDGTAECWANIDITPNLSQYYVRINFPLTFINAPTVSVTGAQQGNVGNPIGHTMPAPTYLTMYWSTNTTDICTCTFRAIGKWK